MVATKNSWSNARLDAYSILQILYLQHREFHKRFCKKIIEQMVIFIQSTVRPWNFTKHKVSNLSIPWKWNFYFLAQIWTSLFSKKRQKNAPFVDDASKTMASNIQMLRLSCWLPPLWKCLTTCLRTNNKNQHALMLFNGNRFRHTASSVACWFLLLVHRQFLNWRYG